MKLKKETAELMLKSEDESVIQFAIDNYPELGAKELPKTWEELGDVEGWYVSNGSSVKDAEYRCLDINRNIFPTRELAEAALALAQLLQLRDRYNGDWKAHWNDGRKKYIIEFLNEIVVEDTYNSIHRVLHFKTAELRDKFLENFKDLIEIAKPLI